MGCLCVYRLSGFDAGACAQPASVAIILKILIGGAPVAFIVLGLVILTGFPITEKVRVRNKGEEEEQQ